MAELRINTDHSALAELRWPAPDDDEVRSLVGAMARIRRTFAYKCGGLTTAEMGRNLPPSNLTLGGLMKHLAHCEEYYFSGEVAQRPKLEPFADKDDDWAYAFVTGMSDEAEDTYRLWLTSVERAQQATRAALERGGPEALCVRENGQLRTLRNILLDLVEEYARHTGHADLIRESIDGRVGEDSPQEQSLSQLLGLDPTTLGEGQGV